jgi:predicted ester cyclase
MPSMTDIANAFFVACETGKGWEGCKAHCTPDATFAAQAEPLADVATLQQYAEWMKGILGPVPDGRYELTSFATDEKRRNVVATAVFHGTHTAEGGPVPPTGKKIATDYAYVMHFDGDKIRHVTKIWNAGFALKQIGWA